MNLSKLNDWLTLASNIGVLVGIYFIWVELNQNELMIRAQMSQERASLMVANLDTAANSDYLPSIEAARRNFTTAKEWFSSLAPDEQQRIRYLYLRDINDLRNQYFLYSQGFLAGEVWDSSTRSQAIRLLRRAEAIGDREQFEGDPGFRETLKRIAEDENLPFPNEGGFWN